MVLEGGRYYLPGGGGAVWVLQVSYCRNKKELYHMTILA